MNRLFNENVMYHEMLMLADKVKNELEAEKATKELTEDLEKSYKRKLQCIYRIRNNAFSLMLRNGLKCTKKMIDGEDHIILNIDGTEYVCKESVLKTLLQKEYDEVIKKALEDTTPNEVKYETACPVEVEKKPVQEVKKEEVKQEPVKVEEVKEPKKESVETEKPEPVQEVKMEQVEPEEVKTEPEMPKQEEKVKVETVPVQRKEVEPIPVEPKTADYKVEVPEPESIPEPEPIPEPVEEPKQEPEPIQEPAVEPVLSTPEETKIPEVREVVYKNYEEKAEPAVRVNEVNENDTQKTTKELLFDIYKFKLKKMDEAGKASDTETEEITLRVMPLNIPADGNAISSDVLVYMKSERGSGCFFSAIKGRKTVMADDKKHSFLVTGQWQDGKFVSTVRPTNKTLTTRSELERTVTRVRPETECGMGHPILMAVEDDNTVKVHCLPLAEKNEEDGLVPMIYCLEYNGTERLTYKTKDKNYIIFDAKGIVCKVSGKWDNDSLKCEIERVN